MVENDIIHLSEAETIAKFLSNSLPFAGVLVGIILGALATHFFSVRRDIAVKRREIILDNLIIAREEVYFSSDAHSEPNLKNLELLVQRLQMVGDKKMVELARRLTQDIAVNKTTNNNELSQLLRDKIRKELGLPELDEDFFALIIHLKGERKFTSSQKDTSNLSANGPFPHSYSIGIE